MILGNWIVSTKTLWLSSVNPLKHKSDCLSPFLVFTVQHTPNVFIGKKDNYPVYTMLMLYWCVYRAWGWVNWGSHGNLKVTMGNLLCMYSISMHHLHLFWVLGFWDNPNTYTFMLISVKVTGSLNGCVHHTCTIYLNVCSFFCHQE